MVMRKFSNRSECVQRKNNIISSRRNGKQLERETAMGLKAK